MTHKDGNWMNEEQRAAVKAEAEALEPVDDRSRRMDGEILVLGRILRVLEDLPEKARRRVIAYLSARFEP